MITSIQRFLKDEEGATAVEYGLLVSGIAMAIAAAVYAFGGRLTQTFTRMGNLLR